MSSNLDGLLQEVARCRLCADVLPLGPRPILRIGPRARLLIASQAPGRRAHESGVPWSDRSGDRLRDWLGVDEATFYDPARVAILPMGLCYPGRGPSGDLPPRPECAARWNGPLRSALPGVQLTLLVGQHSQRHYLGARRRPSLTETVRAYRDYLPAYLPLPHPSPRNDLWLRRNLWFEAELVPELRALVASLVAHHAGA